ncbi:MAG: fibronectin type III domain-containing protein [bacterium]|nr:fibronectin type III domain-containing protein [bacterium]
MSFKKVFLKVSKVSIVLTLVTLGGFACADIALAQKVDQTALIIQLQKQIQQLLNQIQTLQKEVTELKTETGVETIPLVTAPVGESDETIELPELTRSLSLGSRGDDVKKLQEFLARDKEIYPEGLATGFYGPKTVEAIKRWQRKNNVEVVGNVGPKTIAKFRELGQGVVQGLIQQGTPLGMIPPGLLTAPGIQRQMATSTSSGQATSTIPIMPYATMTPPTLPQATTTPAVPAVPAVPAIPGITSAVPATPATPAQPASTSTSASNELKVIYPNGGETWYKGNSYTITWQNPLAARFTGQEKYYWNILLKRGNNSWQANDTPVPVTQSSYVWSKWTGWAEPIPNASDFKVGVSLVDTCAAQVGGICPSANISIIPAGGIDYSDNYFTATSTPPTTTITDRTAPTISSVVATSITSTSAIITWITDEPSDSQIEYGLNNLFGNLSALDTSLTTNHSVTLTGLNSNTTYYYRVKSKDIDGYFASMTNYTFITLAASGSSSTATCSNLTLGFSNNKTTYVLGENGYVTYSCPSTVYVCMRIINPAGVITNIGCHTATSGIDGFGGLSSVGNYTARACYGATGTTDCPTIAASLSFTVIASASNADTTPPVISSVSTMDPAANSATIVWFTNEASDSQVEYGLTTSYGNSTTVTTTLKTEHSIGLTGLTPASTYHYRVKSKDGAGNLTTSNDYTFITLTTAAAPTPSTASTTPSASVYSQMSDQLKSMEIILRGLLGR